MALRNSPSDLIKYFADQARKDPENTNLPSLNGLSSILDSSVPTLREQLEVAKSMGIVEVRPRTGIKRLPYSFRFAVWNSLSYAINVDRSLFYDFAHLRVQVELAFWEQAVISLDDEDKAKLGDLINKAEIKLKGFPVQIPHTEHRELHLTIYRKLDNPFVLGILEAYWDAYESIGLSVLNDINYLEEVWNYHRRIVSSICANEFEMGLSALVEHTDLLALLPDVSVNDEID